MDIKQLARADLNLLISLHVLLEECNVSKAAERLYLSQSAMSRILSRLRDLFDDALFTRVGHGLTPSPKALELQASLAQFLQAAEALLLPSEFNPASYHGEMRIATSEMIGTAILPLLMENLQLEAPNLRISAITRVEHQLEKLAAGELDAAIHPRLAHYGSEFCVDRLVSWPPILIVRKDHPLTKLSSPLSARNMAKVQDYPRVILCMQDIEWFASRWGKDFRKRVQAIRVAVETSNMVAALEIVKRTDCTLYSSPYLCNYPPLGNELASVEIPYSKKEVGEYVMVCHRRIENSDPHQWLRKKILEAAQQLVAETFPAQTNTVVARKRRPALK